MQPFGSTELALAIGAIAIILLAIAAVAGRRRGARGIELPQGAAGDGSGADAAALRRMSSPRLAPEDERPTEDDIARAHLGGTRGSPDLPDAPMTPQRAKKMPSAASRGGHTA
jgi:hypothetical protein